MVLGERVLGFRVLGEGYRVLGLRLWVKGLRVLGDRFKGTPHKTPRPKP